MRVSEWLKQLQLDQAEMRQFEHTPLSHIQQWSELPPLCPLFASIFVFENYPEHTMPSSDRDGAIKAFKHESTGNHERTRYPLTLIVTNNQCLRLQAIFLQNRLQHALVQKALFQLQRLLEGLVDAGDCEVGNLPGPTKQELRELLVADLKNGGQPASTDTVTPYVLPRSPTEQMLTGVLSSLLGGSRVGVYDSIWEIGSHSLMAAQLLAKVRQTFGVALPFIALLEAKNTAELAGKIDQMQKALGSLKSTPLVPIQPDGSSAPLFLIHPIGGGVSFYVGLSRFLGPDQPVYGLQAQDLIGEESSPGFERMEDLARSYVDAIQTVRCRGPYLIGGWSFGGIAAFEIARQLIERGEEVRLLALLDTYPPGKFHPELNRGEILLILGREAAAQAGLEVDLSAEHLRAFSFQDQCSWILEKLKTARLLPLDADLSAVYRYVDGYRKRLRFVLDYRPDRYPGRIALFRASEWDSEFRAAIISKSEHDVALRAITEDTTYGWNRFSTKPVEVYEVSGTHGTLLTEENLPLLSQQLSAAINSTA
jgi:thioesterase domain-containing protein